MCADRAANRPSDELALPAALRRELMSRANRLEARMTVGQRGVNDAIVAQVRQLFTKTDLVKIRVYCEHGSEAEAAGRTMSKRVSCHFVGRVGKTVLLYRPLDQPPDRPTHAGDRP